MATLLIWLVGISGTALMAGVAGLPVALSWPRRVRWIVLSQSLSQLTPPYLVGLDVREVRLTSAATEELTVMELAQDRERPLRLVAPEPFAPELRLMLDEWLVLRTPMLLF